MHVCMCVWVYVCMCVCVHGCMCAWVYVCMGVCVHGCMCAWVHVHVCMCVCVHVCMGVWVHVCMGVCVLGCMWECAYAVPTICTSSRLRGRPALRDGERVLGVRFSGGLGRGERGRGGRRCRWLGRWPGLRCDREGAIMSGRRRCIGGIGGSGSCGSSSLCLRDYIHVQHTL